MYHQFMAMTAWQKLYWAKVNQKSNYNIKGRHLHLKTPPFYIVKTITQTYAYLTCRSVLQPELRGPCRPLPRSQRQMRDSQGNAFPFQKKKCAVVRSASKTSPIKVSFVTVIFIYITPFLSIFLCGVFNLRETIHSRSFENIHVRFWAGKSPKTPLVHPLPFPPV